jgi:hypothetical protein
MKQNSRVSLGCGEKNFVSRFRFSAVLNYNTVAYGILTIYTECCRSPCYHIHCMKIIQSGAEVLVTTSHNHRHHHQHVYCVGAKEVHCMNPLSIVNNNILCKQHVLVNTND